MKYIFIPSKHGRHVKDEVRGHFESFEDNAVISSPHPILLTTEGITDYVAPAPLKPMRSVTKRELVDGLIALGVAAQFNSLLGQLPLPEKLRWEASPTIAPDYPFIAENREMLTTALGITEEQLDGLFRT